MNVSMGRLLRGRLLHPQPTVGVLIPKESFQRVFEDFQKQLNRLEAVGVRWSKNVKMVLFVASLFFFLGCFRIEIGAKSRPRFPGYGVLENTDVWSIVLGAVLPFGSHF